MCLLLIVSLWSLCPGAYSISEAEVQTLKGIKDLRVVIEPPAPWLAQYGVSEKQLQKDVESQLQKAGLQLRNDSLNLFYLFLDSSCGMEKPKSHCVFEIEAGFAQPVLLIRGNDRNKYPTGVATSWTERRMANCPLGHYESLKPCVTAVTKAFVKNYQSVNAHLHK
jgi:hypothetical protein